MRGPPPIFIESAAMASVMKRAEQAARTRVPLPVILTGETGCGKTQIARRIHDVAFGGRVSAPFVPTSGPSLSPDLAASQLRGHVKGSFTGACHNTIGLLERANNGTFFLDELAHLAPEVQNLLLTDLDGRFTPVGSDREVEVNFRLIGATNIDLRALVEAGALRQDLYFRLKGIEIQMPSLRERQNDIPVLVRHYLDFIANCEQYAKQLDITDGAMQLLVAHPWPGNLRELWRVCCLASVETQGSMIRSAHVMAVLRDGQPKARQSVPQETLDRVLREVNDNKTAASRRLGISVRTIQRRTNRRAL